MNLSSSACKSLVAIWCLFCCLVVSTPGFGQNNFYNVRGTVVNGLFLKTIPLTIFNGNNKALMTTNSDSLGRFTFRGLANGKYRLQNKHFRIDTAVTVQDGPVDSFDIILNVCEVDALQAQQDIQAGKAKLLLAGGYAPVYYQGQELFERKYKVSYHDYGCTPPNRKCIKEYNKTVFTYLDLKYGKQWRTQVRKDVVGFR
ncbi:carboxypeptidase-like regulatory domain-containing protein [Mucilaginibacter sp. CSA2-8R]|uniref:carboxypeptidase-like regulatory domain-containing protein n=1 Tax=Mucilaginibacter sp. CSA2-8R TaxID=3141542 RepID=UPI00315C7E3E